MVDPNKKITPPGLIDDQITTLYKGTVELDELTDRLSAAIHDDDKTQALAYLLAIEDKMSDIRSEAIWAAKRRLKGD